MMKSCANAPAATDPACFAFPRIARLVASIDRALGYVGQCRFVYFYYDPRGEEVLWNDGHSYGFGFGGWLAFNDHVAPLAATHGINLISNEGHARHVLLVDRASGKAYFADRASAEAVVQNQDSPAPAATRPAAPPASPRLPQVAWTA